MSLWPDGSYRSKIYAPSLFTLLSRGLPVYSTSGTAANATSSNYSDICTSTGLPQDIIIDISGTESGQRKNIKFAWYAEAAGAAGLYFDTSNSIGGGPIFTGIPVDYTIDVNTGAGGGDPPTTGWTNIVDMENNVYNQREHSLGDISGANWVRIHVTTAMTSTVSLKVDLFDGFQGNNVWVGVGDSRMFFGMTHLDLGIGTAAFGDIIAGINGGSPPLQFNWGMSGYGAQDVEPLVAQWLADFPDVTHAIVNLSINNAKATGVNSDFTDAYTSIVTTLQGNGIIVFCETIGYATDGFGDNIPGYDSAISDIIAATGAQVGVDEYTYFLNHQDEIGDDSIHYTATGNTGSRTRRATLAASYLASH